MGDTSKLKKTLIALLAAGLVGLVLFVSRGGYVSDTLKRLVLPELEAASGCRVAADRMLINVFPLFVEARGITIIDGPERRVATVKQAKAYVDLSAILRKRIILRRLAINGLQTSIDNERFEIIRRRVEAYLAKERETAFKVTVKAVEVRNGEATFDDRPNKVVFMVRGLSGEYVPGKTQEVKASAQKIAVRKEGWPEISGDVAVNAAFGEESVRIRKFVLGSFGSRMTGSGEYGRGKGGIQTKTELLMATIKKIFSLGRSGEGSINIRGDITYLRTSEPSLTGPRRIRPREHARMPSLADVAVDLRVDGDFHIETLMEFLRVKEQVEGMISVKGVIKGPVNNIRATGTATLRRGNLFSVKVDSLTCGVSYADGVMRFTDGAGRLYGGEAKVSASIHLPVVDYFTLGVEFSDIDSPDVFKLIGWDPGVEPGKVRGLLNSEGRVFGPEGWFEYSASRRGADVLGRMKTIKGSFGMHEKKVTLRGLTVATGKTEIDADGTVDINSRTLDLAAVVKASDVTDLTIPYYERLKGGAEFAGRVTGTFDDPVLEGRIRIDRPMFDNYASSVLDGDIRYRKQELLAREVTIRGGDELFRLQGKVYFRKARKLFDLASAEYELAASIKGADFGQFSRIFYPAFKGTGKLQAEVRIRDRADNPTVTGTGRVDSASLYSVPFDSASFGVNYANKSLDFSHMKVMRGSSVVSLDGGINDRGMFSYKASSERLLLSDLVDREIKGDAVFSLKSEGGGTFDNPRLSVDARMIEGRLRGKVVGRGVLTATVKDRQISLRADMIDNTVHILGKGRLEKEVPWEARVDVESGRYDPFISAFLKDVPEDLILNLSGNALLHGDREHVSASATVRQVTLSMYGYSFTNENPIRLAVEDRHLSVEQMTLRSGSTSLKFEGSVDIGQKFNLTAEGSSDISPFKSLSDKIGLLRGNAEMVLSISGPWDSPQINGGVNVSNGSFGLKDYSYRISSLNGYLYVDGDRVVLQKLSGKLGGGDVEITGIVYLARLSMKRFYLEASLKNITVSPSSDFVVNFGGNLVFRGTPSTELVSGDLKINRARYRERVDWKSFLLKAKTTERYKAEISDIEKAELNVRVSAKESLRVDNNVARATLSAEMLLRGTIYRPVLYGRLETTEGTVYFRNNEFRLLHASAAFTDPNRINPGLDIAAETLVSGYKITMNLQGQVDHFTMSLSSEPVLQESDILSLLTVGQIGGNLKGLGGGIGASEATSFVTGKLQDVVEERLTSITGFDRFQVEPHVSKTTGTVEPRVTVSKRLLGDKIFVTYTSSVGSTEEQIVKVEYFLSKHTSLVGVRDERGILGGDIRLRFEFK